MTRDHRINFGVLMISVAMIFYLATTPQGDFAPVAAWWAYDAIMLSLATLFNLMIVGACTVLSYTLWWLIHRTSLEIGRWLPAAFACFFASVGLTSLVNMILMWVPLYWLAIGVYGLCAITSTAVAVATRMRRHELANIVQYLVFRSGGA